MSSTPITIAATTATTHGLIHRSDCTLFPPSPNRTITEGDSTCSDCSANDSLPRLPDSVDDAARALVPATDGVTFYVGGHPLRPVVGYVVGHGGYGIVLGEGLAFSAHLELVKAWLQSLGDHHDWHTVGAWRDNGRLYIDPGHVVRDLDEALALAHRRGEIAIWDLAACESITVADRIETAA